jgi:hypothetical protein
MKEDVAKRIASKKTKDGIQVVNNTTPDMTPEQIQKNEEKQENARIEAATVKAETSTGS